MISSTNRAFFQGTKRVKVEGYSKSLVGTWRLERELSYIISRFLRLLRYETQMRRSAVTADLDPRRFASPQNTFCIRGVR